MSSKSRVFFAGVGTTFFILAVGFGGGLILAKSVFHDERLRPRANAADQLSPVRVILPAFAEAAQPPQGLQAASPAIVATEPRVQPVKETRDAAAKSVEKTSTLKAEAEVSERSRRSAKRKARKLAAARVNQRMKQQQHPQERRDAGIMASGGEESTRMGGVFGTEIARERSIPAGTSIA
jgi:hypothetical protein